MKVTSASVVMSDANENRSHSSSSKTAVSGGSSNREDLDEICDNVDQSFHRMSSQRRRRLWTLAARAGVKRDLQTEEYYNECPRLLTACPSELPYFPEEHIHGAYINRYANQSSDRSNQATTIVVSTENQKRAKRSPEIFEKNQTSSLLGVNVKDYVRRGNRSMKHQKSSTETSGLGSSLDWASTETLNVHTRAFQQRNMCKNRLLTSRKPDVSSSLTPGHSPTSMVEYDCYNLGEYANFVSDQEQSPIMEDSGSRMPRNPSGVEYYPRRPQEDYPTFSTIPHHQRRNHSPLQQLPSNTRPYEDHLYKEDNISTGHNTSGVTGNNLLDRFYRPECSNKFNDPSNPIYGKKSSISRPLIVGHQNLQLPLSPINILHSKYHNLTESSLNTHFIRPQMRQVNNRNLQNYMADYGRPRNPRNYLQIPRMVGNSFDERLRERSPNSSCSDFDRIPPPQPEPGGFCFQHHPHQNRPYLSRRAISLEKPDYRPHPLQHRSIIQPVPSFNSPYLVEKNPIEHCSYNSASMEEAPNRQQNQVYLNQPPQQPQHVYPKIMNVRQRFSQSEVFNSSSALAVRKPSQIPNRFAVSYDEDRRTKQQEERPRQCQSAGFVHFKEQSSVRSFSQNSFIAKKKLMVEERVPSKAKIPEIEIYPNETTELMDDGSVINEKIFPISKKKVSIISNDKVKRQADADRDETTSFKYEDSKTNLSYSLARTSGVDIGLSMKLSHVELNRLAEYWDHSIFARTRLWAVALASISSIIIAYAILSKYWLTSSNDYEVYVSLWYDCTNKINRTCQLTIPFYHTVGSWKAGTSCIILVVLFCAVLGIVLGIAGQFVSSLPKQLYYFHSGGEVFFVSGMLIGLAQIIFYTSIPDKLINNDLYKDLHLGIGFHICFSSVFLYLIASLLLLLDEIIHELTKLATKHPSLKRVIGCIFGCISSIHRERKSLLLKVTTRSKRNSVRDC